MWRLLIVASLGCGDVVHHLPDAPPGDHLDAPLSQIDAPISLVDATRADAAPESCTYVPANSTSTTILSYQLSLGAFQSFGCAPVDPTYWMSGAGMSVTVTFVSPQSRPSIRVWGMNDDDTASVKVNGAAYPLDATSASLAPKVVCGVSPGPDGVGFTAGNLVGINSNGDGNYSYQDVTIEHTNVTSIQISGLTGAGWGYAGTNANCTSVVVN